VKLPSRRAFLTIPAIVIAAVAARRRKSSTTTSTPTTKPPKAPPAGLPWLIPAAGTRLAISFQSAGRTGIDRTVDVPLPAGFPTGGQILALETDTVGKAIGAQIIVEHEAGRAIWAAPDTQGSGTRSFSLYHSAKVSSPTSIAGSTTTGSRSTISKRVESLAPVVDEGDDCFVIQTPMFRCFIQRRGSALSSLLDVDGNDWISYHPEPGQGPRGSFGAYRGIPNFPAPPGMFHPGFTTATTKVVSATPTRIELLSSSNNEPNWTYRTLVYADRVEMTVTNAPTEYWWLYEGTPGGESESGGTLDFRTMRSGNPDSPAGSSWSGKVSWAGFRVPNLGTPFGRTFITVHTTASPPKSSYYLANGVGSPVGSGEEGAMTVFGFGRDSGKSYVDFRSPQTFIFSMIDAKDEAQVVALAESFRLGAISQGSIETRPKA
jgi:hypothetical protein